MLERDVPQIDLTKQIITRLNHEKNARRALHVRSRYVIVFSILVLSFASLYTAAAAANLLQFKWFNINFVIKEKHESGSQISTKLRIEALLSDSSNILKTIDPSEMNEVFPFTIRRPAIDSTFKLDRTIAGWINTNIDAALDDRKRFEPVIYDFFTKDDKWVIVIQGADAAPTLNISSNYSGAWEKVMETSNAVGLYIDDNNESRIDLRIHPFKEESALRLQIIGRLSKGDMIRLAQLYV